MDTQASIQLEESTSIVCVTTSTYKRHPGEVSINDDEVILLYIEAFLISKSVSPTELALVKKSTPGLFFRCRSTLEKTRTKTTGFQTIDFMSATPDVILRY